MTEASARAIVKARSGGRCEACGEPGTDWSHRISRGRQGLWLPSNGLWLDRRCHSWLHQELLLAEVCGWQLTTGERPSDVPAWLRSPYLAGWHKLDDEGGYEPLWEREDRPELPPWVVVGSKEPLR